MTDSIDLAQEAEQSQREAAIAASRCHKKQTPSPDCRICGDEIPEERRKAVSDCNTCIDCQRELEGTK